MPKRVQDGLFMLAVVAFMLIFDRGARNRWAKKERPLWHWAVFAVLAVLVALVFYAVLGLVFGFTPLPS